MIGQIFRRLDLRRKNRFLINTSFRMKEMAVAESKVYGMDRSGEVIYRFNSLGFRGDEYNPESKILIYIAGSSSTFGTGLDWEDTFGFQFKKLYANKFGFKEADIGLMNFSIGAASNSFLVRTLIAQSNVRKPDILICNFAPMQFLEYKSEDKTSSLCPFVHIKEIEKIENVYFNDLNIFVETVKNMLLMQYYCQSKNIKFIFSWIQMPKLQQYLQEVKNTHRFLIEELKLKYFLGKSINQIKTDFAADSTHGGPLTNRNYAELLLKKFIKLYH